MSLRKHLLALPLVLSLACAAPAPAVRAAASSEPAPADDLVLVESVPVETMLDHADIPDAKDVWPRMVDGATRTLDLAEFYVSNAPGSRLEPVVRAIEAAADRGVKVRLLVEEKFYKVYPETLERLAKRPGIQVRRLDTAKSMGGVLHAKYFVVDGREAYLGSQNLDWRSLEHIQELGLRLRVPEVVRSLADVFESDWVLAEHSDAKPRTVAAVGGPFPAHYAGSTVRVTPVMSPQGYLPDPATWDLPKLVKLIDGAKRSVRVQVLTYKSKGHDGSSFPDLEEALERAAARGVKVELLVSDWSKRKGTIEGLQSLQALHAPPGLTVKLVTIPQWSGGFIPFARVVHAKYMVVDGERAWVGTSNWERDYFTQTRNVGVIVEGESFARQLERFFADNWSSPYAAEVDPKATYTAPDVSGGGK